MFQAPTSRQQQSLLLQEQLPLQMQLQTPSGLPEAPIHDWLLLLLVAVTALAVGAMIPYLASKRLRTITVAPSPTPARTSPPPTPHKPPQPAHQPSLPPTNAVKRPLGSQPLPTPTSPKQPFQPAPSRNLPPQQRPSPASTDHDTALFSLPVPPVAQVLGPRQPPTDPTPPGPQPAHTDLPHTPAAPTIPNTYTPTPSAAPPPSSTQPSPPPAPMPFQDMPPSPAASVCSDRLTVASAPSLQDPWACHPSHPSSLPYTSLSSIDTVHPTLRSSLTKPAAAQKLLATLSIGSGRSSLPAKDGKPRPGKVQRSVHKAASKAAAAASAMLDGAKAAAAAALSKIRSPPLDEPGALTGAAAARLMVSGNDGERRQSVVNKNKVMPTPVFYAMVHPKLSPAPPAPAEKLAPVPPSPSPSPRVQQPPAAPEVTKAAASGTFRRSERSFHLACAEEEEALDKVRRDSAAQEGGMRRRAPLERPAPLLLRPTDSSLGDIEFLGTTIAAYPSPEDSCYPAPWDHSIPSGATPPAAGGPEFMNAESLAKLWSEACSAAESTSSGAWQAQPPADASVGWPLSSQVAPACASPAFVSNIWAHSDQASRGLPLIYSSATAAAGWGQQPSLQPQQQPQHKEWEEQVRQLLSNTPSLALDWALPDALYSPEHNPATGGLMGSRTSLPRLQLEQGQQADNQQLLQLLSELELSELPASQFLNPAQQQQPEAQQQLEQQLALVAWLQQWQDSVDAEQRVAALSSLDQQLWLPHPDASTPLRPAAPRTETPAEVPGMPLPWQQQQQQQQTRAGGKQQRLGGAPRTLGKPGRDPRLELDGPAQLLSPGSNFPTTPSKPTSNPHHLGGAVPSHHPSAAATLARQGMPMLHPMPIMPPPMFMMPAAMHGGGPYLPMPMPHHPMQPGVVLLPHGPIALLQRPGPGWAPAPARPRYETSLTASVVQVKHAGAQGVPSARTPSSRGAPGPGPGPGPAKGAGGPRAR